MRPRNSRVSRPGSGDGVLGYQERDSAGDNRPRHGERKRCSEDDCNDFARRHSEKCTKHGGGTRAFKKHKADPDTGEVTSRLTGSVRIPPRVAALLDGEIDVHELDDEELARGYPRAVDGTFKGKPPDVIPRHMYNRMQRELFERANRELKSGLVDVAEMMIGFARNTELDPKVRMDCAKWVFERIMGKPEQALSVDVKKYETIFEGIDRDALRTDGTGDDGRDA